MPDDALSRQLSALRPPPTSSDARDRALHRAMIALTADRPAAPAPSRPRRVGLGLGSLAAATLALCLGAAIALRIAPRLPEPSAEAPARDLLAQLEQLFPGQLNAVIDRDGSLQLDLSPLSPASPPADQALLIELARNGHRLRILAYSGRPVRLELDGSELRFDPLLTADGSIVLSGDDFVWSSRVRSPRRLAGWRIEARPLAPVL